MTVNFFGIPGRGQIGSLNINQVSDSQKSSKSEAKESVSFSSALEGASAAQSSSKVEDAERTARVQALKAQVSNGEYNPDLNKVASSLLKFLVEG
ncbi:MAG: flagellar biosynthesis anti-sigma factor FlgM [Desulfobulbus sp.]|nr:flagellar biosynthesis anti-sigma factor FlgM [Desulfobulbus sp.]